MSVAVVGLTSRRLGRRLAWGMVRRQKCQTLPDMTEKAVDDPLTFSGRGHQGHIYIWTPLDVLWKDIRFLLELVFVLE